MADQICPLSLVNKPYLAYEVNGGKKKEWYVSPDELTTVEGIQYVQLRRTGINHGFARLCASQISDSVDGFTLMASCGYDSVMKLRNEIHSDMLKKEALAKLPMWQRETATFKRQKKTRGSIESEKAHRGVLDVPVPGVGDKPNMVIKILKPIEDNKDELRVEFDVNQIHHIIQYIAAEGFDVELKRKTPNKDLPKGVIAKGDKYIVTFPTPNKFGKHSRTVASLQEAHAAIENPDAPVAIDPYDVPIDGEPEMAVDEKVRESCDESAAHVDPNDCFIPQNRTAFENKLLAAASVASA